MQGTAYFVISFPIGSVPKDWFECSIGFRLLSKKERAAYTQLELRLNATRYKYIIENSAADFKGSFAQKILLYIYGKCLFGINGP